MKENAKQIGYFGHQPSGCSKYRIKNPMEMLNVNGVGTLELHIDEDVDDTVILNLKAFQFYGATQFSLKKVFDFFKSNGKKIIYDVDDALTLIDTSNYLYYSVKRDIGSFIEALNESDHITVSTPYMASYVATLTNKPITVIPNCYNPSEWTYPRPKREGFRIGFAGSATHVKDLIDIIPVIENLQKKYDKNGVAIKFLIMGFGQSDYKKWYNDYRYAATDEAVVDLIELDKRLSKIQFEWIPYMDFKYYPSTLINMSLDIGLCPLKDTPFNRCRSACKAMEYTLSGALALAQNCDVYKEDFSSVLVKDNQWESVIEYYINNPISLENDRAARLTWIQDNRNIQTQLEPLKKVYLN